MPAINTASGAFQHVEQQRRGGEPLVAGAQHIGRADIAGADVAHVAKAGGAGQQQAERDRAEQIAESERKKRSGNPACPLKNPTCISP